VQKLKYLGCGTAVFKGPELKEDPKREGKGRLRILKVWEGKGHDCRQRPRKGVLSTTESR